MKKILPFFALLACAAWVKAHPMPNTLIALSVSPQRWVFEIKIPLSDVETVVFQQTDSTSEGLKALPTFFVLEQYFSKHLKIRGMNGAVWQTELASLDTLDISDPLSGRYAELHATLYATPPPDADARQFFLFYDAILHQIVTHQAIVSIRQDWENGIYAEGDPNARLLAVIQVESTTGKVLPVAVSLEKGSTWKGFQAMFRLGMQHIAEGYDHLLFLFVLLLPAPLLTERRRWAGFGGSRYSFIRLLKIVTAFTIGHSLTLAIGALGWLRVPSQPVEVFIAFSILVSAAHALRPIFSGRETWVAAGFGLVHGLAFATILVDLGLDASRLALSILGFNLGIETMQLAVVAVALPVLMTLSRTRFYPVVRIGGAVVAGVMALIWLWQRLAL